MYVQNQRKMLFILISEENVIFYKSHEKSIPKISFYVYRSKSVEQIFQSDFLMLYIYP